jgi:hypothetical protein
VHMTTRQWKTSALQKLFANLVTLRSGESWRSLLNLSLNLLQAILKLFPLVHDDLGVAVLGQHLCHLFLLLLALFDAVDANVADQRDACAHCGRGSALAVFNCHALLRLDAEFLAGMEVDGWVRLAGGRVQGGGGAVDVLVGEVVVDADFLHAGHDTGFGGGADNGHWVAHLLHLLELLGCAGAGGCFLAQLGGDGSQLAVDVGIELFWGHGEVVFLLETDHHAAEIVADEVFEELLDGVAV